jgi:hypothetical protein
MTAAGQKQDFVTPIITEQKEGATSCRGRPDRGG